MAFRHSWLSGIHSFLEAKNMAGICPPANPFQSFHEKRAERGFGAQGIVRACDTIALSSWVLA
jgi:hypothetical protein